jgi:glucosamine--fructose-6-phosphate aminotransferase (isomerizing)
VCGIVGYLGEKAVIPLLIGGLEKLEYRGYDSAGVATLHGGKFEVFRSEGKLANLKRMLEGAKKLPADAAPSANGLQTGIGHTRWATHGRPNETNAHPHVAGKICLVHNGIIENYAELRERLQKLGRKFLSETDTEIAGHLIDLHLKESSSLLEAVRKACSEFRGAYAFVVMSADDPSTLVVAKNSTPIIIGLGEGENFVASDIPAILQHTRRILVLEDGEIGEVKRDSVHIERSGAPVEREPFLVTWDAITAEKGGFRHFMLKEIHEQPQVVMETLRGRIDQVRGAVQLPELRFSPEELSQIDRIVIVACGTAWHAGLVTKFFIEQLARIPVEVDYGSEFRYRPPLVNGKTLFLVISQSGETIDTLGSLGLASEVGAKTMAICNVVGSSITRRASNVLYTHAGPEMSVASTKAFVTQLVAGYLFALYLGAARKLLNAEDLKSRFEELTRLPHVLADALATEKQVEKIARKYGRSNDFLFLGRGVLYPVALEGALKLKEISYVHAEGYPAGEMKHGPIALVNEETPVVVVLGRDGVNFEKTISNMTEISARGGRVIVVTDVESSELRDIAWEVVTVGAIPQSILPMALTIPLQLLAYHVAVYRGTDVDQPRNLAKSVVVE